MSHTHRMADDGSRRHGAAQVRGWSRVDGYVQEGGTVWHRGGVDDGSDKVDASVPALEMDRWKMAAATYECAGPV